MFRSKASLVVFLALYAMGAFAAELEAPAFDPPVQSFQTPIQTGLARPAKVTVRGLYELPDPATPGFLAGRSLPLLYDKLVFVRVVDDFYTGTSLVWSGALKIQGDPGNIPPPAPNAVVREDASYRVVARIEQDVDFQHNYLKHCAPNWYFEKSKNIIGEVKNEEGVKVPDPVSVIVEVPQPLAEGEAVLRVALNADAPPGKPNKLSVRINGELVLDAFSWEGPGYKIIRHPVPASLLRNGLNEVQLLGDPVYIKHLDYVEIEAPARPMLQARGLVLHSRAAVALEVPRAKYAVDITEFGQETALTADDSGRFPLVPDRLYYFADKYAPLELREVRELALPDTAAGDYIVLGMEATLPVAERFLEWKRERGYRTQSISLEQAQDVFNGGMYGPGAILGLLEHAPPAYLLLLGGFHRDSRGREEARKAIPDWHPGIPAGLRQLEQLTVSDELYALGGKVQVGRVPLASTEDLSAWMDKAMAYNAPDHLVLLSGKNDRVEFSGMQRTLIGRFPAALVEAEGQLPEVARNELLCALEAQGGLVLYQGHAQSWAIDEDLLDGTHASLLPPSSWVLATCNSAYYHADFDVYVRDWMAEPGRGCVNALAASSVGAAGQQDQLLRRFLDGLRMDPGIEWGAMLQYLRENLPLEAKTMADPNLPDFLKRSIPADRMTIDAYSLLGDPSAPILARERRTAEIQIPRNEDARSAPLPSGPVSIVVDLAGPWDLAETDSALRMMWRVRGTDSWQAMPLETSLVPGANTFLFDALAGGTDGGRFELRLVECREGFPEIVWASSFLVQESFLPIAPEVDAQKATMPRISPDPVVVCVVKFRDRVYRQGVAEYQFQVRDAASPDRLLADSEWQPRRRFVHKAKEYPAGIEVRARMRTPGGEGEWSPWTPLTEAVAPVPGVEQPPENEDE